MEMGRSEGGRKTPGPAWELECLSLESSLSLSLQLLGSQDMSKLVPIVLESLKDPRPRIRWAAADTIRVLSVRFAPAFQEQYHHIILPPLIALMADRNRTVGMYAALAVRFFSRDCTPEMLQAFLFLLPKTVLRILENDQDENLMVAALGALASVASVLKDNFRHVYMLVMSSLKAILVNELDASKLFLRTNCLECISHIAIAVGNDKFSKDVEQVMEALISLQGSLEGNHVIKIYFLGALVNLCICLGQDFLFYVRQLMPVLIQSANINVSVFESFRIHALNEKALACKMLSCCASQLKEKFFPWIDQVAEIMVPLLNFNQHLETRMTAISAMPELLSSASLAVQKGLPEGKKLSDIHYLVDDIIRELVNALMENDIEVSGRVLQSLHECMQVSDSLLTEAHVQSIQDGMRNILNVYLSRKLKMANYQEANGFEGGSPENEKEDGEGILFQEAARGIGFCAEFCTAIFNSHAKAAVERLDSVICHSATSRSNNAMAAAISAIGKIMVFHLDSVNTSEVSGILVPLLTSNQPLHTRIIAISAMPELLHSATLAVQMGQLEGKSLSDIHDLVDNIIAELLKVLMETDIEVSVRVFKSLNECIQVSGSLFTEAHVKSILDRIHNVLNGYLSWKLEMANCQESRGFESGHQENEKEDWEEILCHEAARGIGACAQFCTAMFKTHAAAAVEILDSVICHSATSYAAISAIGKILVFHLDSINASEVFPKWLEYLPLRNDWNEARIVHEQLFSLVEKFQTELLGTDSQLIRKTVAIVKMVVDDWRNLTTIETGQRGGALVVKFRKYLLLR